MYTFTHLADTEIMSRILELNGSLAITQTLGEDSGDVVLDLKNIVNNVI